MNFETDVYEQIKGMSKLETLDKAARLAGQQLELLKPAAMAPRKTQGLYIGPVAYVERNSIAIVIADAKKVMTIRIIPQRDTPSLLQQAAGYVREIMLPHSWCPASSAKAAEEALKKYGGKPGKKCPEVCTEVAVNIVGALFAYCSSEQIHDLGTQIDVLRKADICPFVICLVGPASSGKKDMFSISTMMLPLAPYVEAVIDA
jgi:hypothetical protein